MSFKEYSNWYCQVIKCRFCNDYRKRKGNGFICNSNIDGTIPDGSKFPIRPQAGFIDAEWFNSKIDNKFRVLLLGLNPGKGYSKHDELYEVYDKMVNGSDIIKIDDPLWLEIKKEVKTYDVVKYLREDLEKMINQKGKKMVFAYSNQVLCRTDPEASKILVRSGIREVYENCFRKNVSKLINIIHPDVVIVVGTCWKNYFIKEKDQLFPEKYCITAYHPSYGRKNKTLKQIEDKLNEFGYQLFGS